MKKQKGHVSYNFRLKPVPGGAPLESKAGWTAEQMAADFFDTKYEPTIGVYPGQGASLPCPVDITLGVDKDGRLAVTGLHVDAAKHGAVVTATGLRQIGAMITDLLRRISAPEAYELDGVALLAPILEGLAVPYEGVAVRPGRHGYPPEQYRQWGREYLEALVANSDHPYTPLVRRWVCTESQARRRIQTARRLFPELFEEVTP